MPQKVSKEIMNCLNEVFQSEMAGIIRYLHYSFMIFGYTRIPIQKWFRDLANEGMAHAILVGEKITGYGGHPTLKAAEVPETRTHQIDKILEECLRFERHGLALYQQLAGLAGGDIALEEMARQLVREETDHIEEVEKMLRKNK